MIFSRKKLTASSLLLIALFGSSSRAPGHRRLVVSANVQSCPEAEFTRIQDAIDASSSGDHIHICNGVYHEQPTVTKSSLDIDGDLDVYVAPTNALANATSLASGEPIAAGFSVIGAEHVNISVFTVDAVASGIAECSPRLIGVFYQNASGVIDTVRVRNTKLGPGLSGCQSGTGISTESGNGVKSKVEIRNCAVSQYQKNGITANETGTEVFIHDNIVTGIGPTTGAAQNGIQIGFGASGAILKNTVAGNLWLPCVMASTCQAVATDILVYQSDSIVVRENTALLSQVGIFMSGNNGIISLNKTVFNKVFDGIRIEGNGNSTTNNRVLDSAESDVFVNGNDNSITENTLEHAPIGILKTSSSVGNRIENNRYIDVQIEVQDPPTKPLSQKISPDR